SAAYSNPKQKDLIKRARTPVRSASAGGKGMPIFTIEVEGRAVLSFVAPNLRVAQAALEDEGDRLRDGLSDIANLDGTALMRDGAKICIREATDEEESVWHAGVALAVNQGALEYAHDAISEGFAVYLIAVSPANDDAPKPGC